MRGSARGSGIGAGARRQSAVRLSFCPVTIIIIMVIRLAAVIVCALVRSESVGVSTMSLRNRLRGGAAGGAAQACCTAAFSRQPPRILVVDTAPPWWSEVCHSVCEALDGFLTLASGLDGPCRIPLLSLYSVSSHTECLLPLAGCVRMGDSLLQEAVQDGLLQFKQYLRHVTLGGPISSSSAEVTVLTSRPGRGVVKQLEIGLKDTHLVNLRRLVVVCITHDNDPSDSSTSPQTPSPVGQDPEGRGIHTPLPELPISPVPLEEGVRISAKRAIRLHWCGWRFRADPALLWLEIRGCDPALLWLEIQGCDPALDNLLLGTEIELQQVENDIVALESVFKGWLHDIGGDREHLHLLLPSLQEPKHPVCLKCDVQERLLSPALFPSMPELGAHTETARDFHPPAKGPSNQSTPPHRLTVIRALKADAVCESLLFGLPLILRPTCCWQLDWDEMEDNHHHFHALCHALRAQDWFLLARCEQGSSRGAAEGRALVCHFLLQASASLSLLLKPVATRELLLPCALPIPSAQPPASALATIQSSLAQLEEDPVFNPLCLKTHLYPHLRHVLSRSPYPYRAQQRRDSFCPPEGAAKQQVRDPYTSTAKE
ncbi:hypothetical protein JZ751_015411 [Albula glossodonta]|uniref:Meiosis 1 arrest protein n=1 Tax=Albula glossodonta TaxID=121402 RepID=A0A8T2MVB5_9TELE|nr:hypothetical protein JZ751_015411 [Albula glossodonta]